MKHFVPEYITIIMNGYPSVPISKSSLFITSKPIEPPIIIEERMNIKYYKELVGLSYRRRFFPFPSLFYNIAKRHPAAAISQNQNGRETIEELDLAVLEELDEEVEEDPEEPEVDVAAEAAWDAFASAAVSVEVTFKLKLETANVTLPVECQVSDPNWRSPR